jgi:hypothetical protein
VENSGADHAVSSVVSSGALPHALKSMQVQHASAKASETGFFNPLFFFIFFSRIPQKLKFNANYNNISC